MKVVVVHRGARDHYQVARGLYEARMLESLVTDLHWPADRPWARTVERLAGRRFRDAVRFRNSSIPSSAVAQRLGPGAAAIAADRAPGLPFETKRNAIRWCDRRLGEYAGRLATERGAALLSYSYYGHSAFSTCAAATPKMLFQLHPHPTSVRRILGEELRRHPECQQSLAKEWELSLPEQDFSRLVEETRMAHHWIAASSFTRTTLIENGADASKIHVTPYGVDLEKFRPPARRERRNAVSRRLRLLFVGTINQRKGISYLVDALRLVRTPFADLLVCGRVVDNLALFAGMPNVQVRPSVSFAELVQAYASADLFVFPSLAEGFGHVLLEALASGVPILSTNRTAAPDLITEGIEGFVVPPGSAEAVAERIEWALANPARLGEMAEAARVRAESFTWAAFRTRIANLVRHLIRPGIPSEEAVHV